MAGTMIRIKAILFLVISIGSAAFACDYTVRDIGFVQLTDVDYRLLVIAPASPAELAATRSSGRSSVQSSAEQQLAEDVTSDRVSELSQSWQIERLADWNVEMITLPRAEIDLFPAAMREQLSGSTIDQWSYWLVDRVGRCLLLETSEQPMQSNEIQSMLTSHVLTPSLTQLRDNALQAYAQIVLFESQSMDASVLETVEEGRTGLGSVAHLLSKPIANPVRALRIPYEKRDEERTLLWAIGCPENQADEPIVAIVYGRGRLAGPAIKGESIQVNSILSQLALVGAACECETDRSWFDEYVLPMHWPTELKESASKVLGYNPESSLVKAEICGILMRGYGSQLAEMVGSVETSGQERIDKLLAAYHRAARRSPDHDESVNLFGQQLDATSVVKATVIAGNGWGFDEPASEDKEPVMVQIPAGSSASAGSAAVDSATLAFSANSSQVDAGFQSSGNGLTKTILAVTLCLLGVIAVACSVVVFRIKRQ